MLKHSKQREAIRTSLHNRCDHPTADVMYREMRTIFPRISLGTVYRNLSLLCDIGEAQLIITGDGVEHFDGSTEPHDHFQCRECGRVFDVPAAEPAGEGGLSCSIPAFDGIVETRATLYTGLCGDCIRKS